MKRIVVGICLAAALLLSAGSLGAAELKVLSAQAMRVALKDASDNFARMTGNTLSVTYDPAGVVKGKFEKGEPADVVILPKPDMAALVKARKIAPDSVHAIARSELSIGVRKGQAKPDISSVAAVKKALLAAKSIAYFDPDPKVGFAPGIIFQRDLARLGIAKQVAAKAKLWKSPDEMAAEKTADLIIGWKTALLPKSADYDLVGPLPAQLQDLARSIWVAGASAKSADPETAGDLTRVLASPETFGVFKGKGFAPP